jgi:hypothetical protein
MMRRRMMLPMGRRYRRRRFLVGGFTMLLVGGAAYKLGQSSVKQIEQHTGKPAEELSEEELQAAMDELGIEEEEITEADKAAIEAEAIDGAPAQAASAAPAAPAAKAAAPAASSQADYIEELKKLAELKEVGIITEEEFEAKKKQLLGL